MERARILVVVVAVLVVALGLAYLLRGGGESGPGLPGSVEQAASEEGPEAAATRPGAVAGDRTTVAAGGDEDRAAGPVGGRRVGASLIVSVALDSGEVLAGVEVFSYPDESGPWPARNAAVTGTDGVARFDSLPPGTTVVEAALGGASRRVEVVAGRETEVALVVPAGATVDGVVVDPDGRPIAEARVWISGAWDDARGGVATRTDERGVFQLRGVGRGRMVAAWAEGYAASPVYPVLGERGQQSSLRIVLSRATGTVSGRVADVAGAPVAGAIVRVGAENRPFDRRAEDGSRIRGPAPRETRSGSDGTFEVRHLEPGSQAIGVAAPAHAPIESEVRVEVGVVTEANVTLREGAAVEGVCRDGQGATLAGVQLAVVGASRLATRTATSAPDGSYRLVDVAIGEVELAALQRAGAVPAVTTTVVTRPGETVRWDPVLTGEVIDPAQVIAGRVVGFDGRGIEGYRVVAEPDPPARATPVSRVTGRDGAFQLAVPWERARLFVYEKLVARAFPVAFADGIARGTAGVELRVDEAAFSGVRGRVVDTAGFAVAATLQVWHTDARVWREVPAQQGTGVVELAPMLPGECTLEVRSADHPWLQLGEKVLPAGSVLDLGDLVLQPGGRVEGTVAFVDGGLPTAVSLRFVDESAGREVGVAEVRDGRFRSSTLPLGNLTMVVEGDGVAATRLPVALDASTPIRVVELSIRRGVPVTLRLGLSQGMERPAWLNVGIFKEREAVWTRGVGRAAALEVTVGLAPGEYRVLVQAGVTLADVPIRVAGQPVAVDVPLRAR